ncbi:hypothetical protein DFJ74DRAFT_766568 [Hyaloraphidium curvatum]|nr:hypothetical protein DFJ74DRAFT_766568 [Hyaloraphidium curvatum]
MAANADTAVTMAAETVSNVASAPADNYAAPALVAGEAVPEKELMSTEPSIALPKAGEKISRLASWAVTDPNQLNPAFFSFKDISCVLKVDRKPKVLLDAVSGYCKPGETLAIMGPSGAGKSTLLDVLAYRKTTGKWTQDVRLNGAPLSKRTFIKESGYVTSDDLLPPELTCKEMLRFGAALRLPADWSTAQREARCSDVLEVMRLGYCADRRIGNQLVRGLSTGERKRMNVAMELLPVASVLFLDEPTTGLDSNTGREIIANVVEVTRLRKLACVATIHQPSYTILSQFDYLLLLAKGKLCYFGRVTDAILYFESLGIPVAGNPAEIYADALAAQPDRLIECWEASQESAILNKKVEAIHSGQGSINEVIAKADTVPTFADRLGFYQQAPVWVQFWQLLKRQVMIYIRNPVMSTSRFVAGAFVGLFFGGAFWNLQRNVAGYEARASEGFAYKLMVPGFGSAAIAYWLEKRKMYYHEEAAGYYHRLGHLLVMFLVEWIFIAAVMSVVGGIMFSMSNWVYTGRYIGYMIPEAFASTAINMVCAYVAASIPYANAIFTLHYYYAILLGAFYITDQFLFVRHPSVKAFWQWFSYVRLWFVPTMRDECVGQPLFCLDRELFPFDTTGISSRGIGGAAKNLTTLAVASSPALVQTMNSFDIWPNAGAEANATIFSLYRNAIALSALQKARAQAAVQNNAAPVLQNLDEMTALATAGFSAATNIPVSNTDGLTLALNQTVRAASLLGFANYLVANPLPPTLTCFSQNGEQYVAGSLGFDWWIRNASNAIVGFGIDNYATTSTGFYIAVAFITGVGWLIVAYLALWLCNFRQK